MKNILTYLNTIVLVALLLVSCNSNEYANFDDANAFVAFNQPSVSVSEDAGFIEIPVTLASVAGIGTTVRCEIINGKAKDGVDYQLEGDGSLVFDSQTRVQKLKINIINRSGVYTGDLDFVVKFNNTGNVNAGAADVCVVTITDLDHPLSALLGEYTANGEDYWDGPSVWTMRLVKDAKDASKVWFFNIANLAGNATEATMFYGVVSVDLTKITIPLGQLCAAGLTLGGIDEMEEGIESGNVMVAILDGGKRLDFGNEIGFWCYKGSANYAIVMPGITCVKK